MAFDHGMVWFRVLWNLRAISLATLTLVIGVVATLQYRWISQVSDAQELRVKARLSEEVRLISDALDIESTRALMAFTISPHPASGAYGKLDETWAAWNHEAPWPQIVSGVLLFEGTEGGWQRRAWGDAGPFNSRSLPVSGGIVSYTAPQSGRGGLMRVEARNQNVFVDGEPYSVWPLPAPFEPPAPPRMNWLVLHYNGRYLAEVVFPQLLAKYFAVEDRLEFRFQLGFEGPPPPRTEVIADALHFRPDCLMPSSGGATVSVAAFAGEARSVAFGRRGFRSEVTVGDRPSLSRLLHTAGRCAAAAPQFDSGMMQIVVHRSKTALGGVFVGFRRRNELLSSVVLAILVVAIAALVVSTERARRLARVETVLAAGLSHELRTPLSSLGVAADDLRSGYVVDQEQARRYGEIIGGELRRLGHIVDQALALTGLTQSNRPVFLQSVSVPEIVKTTLDRLAPRLNEAQIQVEVEIEQNTSGILADPDLVSRSLTNLVENAIKYAGSGRWVRLSARPGRHSRRSGVEIMLEDRGPGISDDEAVAVFEPFYRGTAARRCRETGSGLGLAIVKSAVRANGGWIKLERAVPHGCRFRLFFLAADDPDNSGAPA
jgi:signal transduction histidine kinase